MALNRNSANRKMDLGCIVSRISVAAFVIFICAARAATAASSNQPRPVVVSTNPIDGALDVSVLTAVVVDFSEPMNCNSLTPNTATSTVTATATLPGSTCPGDSNWWQFELP
jgi:hypothetical protein